MKKFIKNRKNRAFIIIIIALVILLLVQQNYFKNIHSADQKEILRLSDNLETLQEENKKSVSKEEIDELNETVQRFLKRTQTYFEDFSLYQNLTVPKMEGDNLQGYCLSLLVHKLEVEKQYNFAHSHNLEFLEFLKNNKDFFQTWDIDVYDWKKTINDFDVRYQNKLIEMETLLEVCTGILYTIS